METKWTGATVAVPNNSRVTVRIEISTDLNITASVACQKANRYLLLNLGDQLHAGVPELMVGEQLLWRVPILLSFSQGGFIGKVGDLRVDAQSGIVAPYPPDTLDSIAAYADLLYDRATQTTRTAQ